MTIHYACPVVQCSGPVASEDCKTAIEKSVTCAGCRDWLRRYNEAFPKPTEDGMGGRR